MDDIILAMHGDLPALEHLLLANADYLERTAYLYLSNDSDVQDAISDTVLQAVRGIKKLQKPQFFKTWLTKILIRQCYRRYSKRRHDPILLEELPAVPVAGSELSTEQRLDLLAGLRQLNDANRQAILMHYFNGLSILEIAQITKLSPNTIKSQLLRGKQQLRNWLGDDYFAN